MYIKHLFDDLNVIGKKNIFKKTKKKNCILKIPIFL